MTYPPDALALAIAHCEATYPNEGCGVFLQAADGTVTARGMQNVIDRYHAKDPERFPRTSRTAYLFSPGEQLEVFEGADARGERVVAIFHSHADVGAYFSEEDRRLALVDGQPLLPGVDYLVISVRGRADALKLYRWHGDEFVESSIALPR